MRVAAPSALGLPRAAASRGTPQAVRPRCSGRRPVLTRSRWDAVSATPSWSRGRLCRERVSERLLSRWGRARPGPGLCSGCSGPVVPWLSLRPAPARVCAAESADGPGPQQTAAGVGQGACRAASEAATAAAGSRARPWAAGARCSLPLSAEVLFKTFFFSERIFG